MTMKTPGQWREELPIVGEMMDLKEIFWRNPDRLSAEQGIAAAGVTREEVKDAAARLERFAPYIRTVFPDTEATGGIIESPLTPIPNMQAALGSFPGRLLLKQDSHLPISGSVKARGGIYEILHLAEDIAVKEGKLALTDDYAVLAQPEYKEMFSKYAVAVGSTGNLGLSIGIMSAMLGFRVTVHMSADARQWKKDMLRSKGVTVVEYADDYSKAVAEGRRQAALDPMCHFVDDENSKTLFLGYAVAALRLEKQLAAMDITVDGEHPLCVYLPCGVGGGPGGVAFGLKLVFGDSVHCFFAEPTHCPSMTLGLVTGLHDGICVQDVGIDNITAADGLACGRPSRFVGKAVGPLVSGSFTVQDEEMYRLLRVLADTEGIRLEPSALAGVPGMGHVCSGKYDKELALENAVHIAWATGGSMVPAEIWQDYYECGK